MIAYNKTNKGKVDLDKIKSKDLFANIKSNYILQKIFTCLIEKKSLKIVKYNRY